jgi:LPS sulfotransferase NodH
VNTKTTRNEVFGFKLMSWYLDDFLARLREAHGFGNSTTSDLELLCSAFPRLRFLRIVRRHKLRQALSTARALQTGLWKVQKSKSILREPEFDPGLIEQSLHEAERQEKIWDDFFRRIEIKPLKVEYEKLCQDYERTIHSVLNFLTIKLPAGARVGPPVTTRQADEISRTWEKRFLAERPSAYSPASG